MHWGVFYHVIKLKGSKGGRRWRASYMQLTAWKRREGKNDIKWSRYQGSKNSGVQNKT